MATKTQKKEVVMLATPVGRLINSSLWTKDSFTDAKGREADPAYKIEMAFDLGDEWDAFEGMAVEAAIAAWGPQAEDAYWAGTYQLPILDGDELAAKRVAAGKNGDAYVGKVVLRASTIFNKHGDNAAGGVKVVGVDGVTELGFAEQDKVYNGSFGVAAVMFSSYDTPKIGIKAYLAGYQFIKDGDRIRGERDFSGVFKPMGNAPTGTLRRRRGG